MAFESFVLTDMLVDMIVLAAVQAGLDKLCLKKLLRALMAALAMTILFYLMNPSAALRALLQIPCFILLAALLRGTRKPRILILTAACLLGGMAVSAGIVSMFSAAPFPRAVVIIIVAIASISFYSLLRCRRNPLCAWRVLVELKIQGRRLAFPALIDTGNTLREMHSGQAVMIVERRLLEKARIRIDPADGIACYAALGNSGRLPCLRADSISIHTALGITIQAPGRWIAVYPEKIPGGRHALAPASYAAALAAAPPSTHVP